MQHALANVFCDYSWGISEGITWYSQAYTVKNFRTYTLQKPVKSGAKMSVKILFFSRKCMINVVKFEIYLRKFQICLGSIFGKVC